MKLFVL